MGNALYCVRRGLFVQLVGHAVDSRDMGEMMSTYQT